MQLSIASEGLSIRQFVQEHHSEMTNNHMTRILAGVPPEAGKIVDDDEVLQRAKENIERYFVVVGTMEDMDGVMRFLGQRFWWREHHIPNLNVSTLPKGDLDDKTLATIVEANRLDIALYDWVRGRPGGMVAL